MTRSGDGVMGTCVSLVLLLTVSSASSLALNDPALPTPDTAPSLSPPSPPSLPCGDGLCRCADLEADCSNQAGRLTYVPTLPDGVTRLNLSGNDLASLHVTHHFFANVTNVFSLDLSNNGLTDITRDMLRGLNNLYALFVDDNPGLTVESLQHALSLPPLRSLLARHCSLHPPPVGAFRGVDSITDRLDLSSNPHGGTYDLSGFCSLQHLPILELNSCDFRDITSSCALHVSFLDLTGNALRAFPNTCVGDMSMFPILNHLKLTRNRIETISTEDVCLPILTSLDLSYNLIKVLTTGTFSGARFPFLTTLNLNRQSSYIHWFRVGTKIENNTFDNPSLNHLQLGYSELEFADQDDIGRRAFANCPQLQTLELDGNTFLHADNERFLELFGHLRSLSYLVLSNSKFEIVSSKTFANFAGLELLDLSDNLISNIPDGAFDSLAELVSLDLSNNKLTVVKQGMFGARLRHTLKLLTLQGNPFVCTCDLMWFRRLLVSDTDLLVKDGSALEDYTCHNKPDMTLVDFSLPDQACLLQRELSVVIILVTSMVVLTLTCTSLLFRFRWHLRLLLYEAFRGNSEARRRRLLADHFLYDVFVSFSGEDLSWVRRHLMPQLEGGQGLRLCVHERDFIPGRNIVDNIVDCVHKSKKVLMVFSKEFVRSPWCQFELTFCLRHVMEHDDVLIVVCVDDVASREVTSAMMAVFKTTTYIQWEDQGPAVTSFWGRLRLALQEVTQADQAGHCV